MAVAPLDVLCCRITIGDPDAGNPMSILNPITLTEVQEVEIVETYKKLIGTATIRFPKGTVVIVRFFSRRIFTAVACRVPVSAFAGRAVAATCRHGFPPRYAPRASGKDLRGTPGIGVPPLLSR